MRYIFSHLTGLMVHVHQDGNVTATTDGVTQGAVPGRFFFRHDGGVSADGLIRHNISLKSVDYNGSYLHFVQLVPVPGNDSTANFSSGFGNGTAANETELVNQTIPVADPVLMLVLGDIDVEDEEGVIRHIMWTEEKVHESVELFRYRVTLDDGKVCYLAFDTDGKPVENPCLTHEELDDQALFFTY